MGRGLCRLLLIAMLSLVTALPVGAADYEQRQAAGNAILRIGADRVEGDRVEMALSREGTLLTFTLEGAFAAPDRQ